MLIGDAGYGAVFFALTFFARLKFGKKLQDASLFILFYILSSCAIIWGALTGTFFGQEWLPQSVEPLIPALRDNKNIQAFCFFLGAFHLSIAHLWRTIVKIPSVTAFAEAGWILILWGAFFLSKTLILGDTLPVLGKWLFIAGPLLVIFFTNPQKNIFKGIGTGINNLIMSFVNTITDVVSYIRLFAVGLAGVAIADAFNNMAMGIGYNSVLTGAATSLILVLGHSLNILLGPLAILVHGVRLNLLEFSGHMNITWSGFSYKPLRK
jgi:V/A-type H+-transporting ATPase subunit I